MIRNLISTICTSALLAHSACADSLDDTFTHPPDSAKPSVLWMWMGGNVSSNGITRDLAALHDAGFGGAMVFSLADVCTPWARAISHCPTPEVVTFTDPWWKLVRHAAQESRRLGMEFGVHNCAGYESSGGPWITPDLPPSAIGHRPSVIILDLGTVHALAEVWLNGKNRGVIWTAPWRVDISTTAKAKRNKLEIKVTNVWANRLIGDEQHPADSVFGKGDMGNGGPLKGFPDWFVKGKPRPTKERYTFTTWNYFTKDSPLVSSGLLGPVTLCHPEPTAKVR